VTTVIDEEAFLAHFGILRRSGRYPWGSGGNQAQRHRSFLETIDSLRKEGLTETEIAKGFEMTTTQLRALKSIARNAQKQSDIGMAQRLKDKGYSNSAIGRKMGVNESSVRALLAPGQKDRADVLEATSNMLKDQVARKGMIDVGVGVERHIGVSQTKLNTALARLQEEGYQVHRIKVEQLGTGKQTELKVLAGPNTTQHDVWKNRANIQSFTDMKSDDGGRTFFGIQKPLSISSNRLAIRYADQGGKEADGVIYVRPGVKDVSLGKSRYAQVRIAIDGTHYVKGMAMYKDDLPKGVDLVFNTNKTSTGNKHDALKPMSDDPDNPFGAIIHQITETGANGKRHVTSAMNIVGSKEESGQEGGWETWSRTLSSQFLSKQSPKLAQQQLDMTFEKKQHEFNDIMKLTNPTVRQHLLERFADSADSSAVHLKAAALPRQASHVILPVNSLKENEIYAPNYKNGERVVLVRHPHGGTFELPELTVNNRHPEAKRLLGNAPDAVGINAKVASRLSGADFDGDTVIVIPNPKGSVKTKPALAGLKNFDPIGSYPKYPGMPRVTEPTKQMQMGLISNLITDMTIKGASDAELARAVRHSMVVIDSEKHQLNYKQSAIDNGISQLRSKYQNKASGGASTLISRSGSNSLARVPEFRERPAKRGGPIDKATGKKVFEPTGATRVDRKGRVVPKTTKVSRLALTSDAHKLSSGTPIEKVYADHSNKLKDLANKARFQAVNTKHTSYSPSAKKTYAKEVASLDAKLNIALRNAPLERHAQLLANAVVSQKRRQNPDMDKDTLKKIKFQALAEQRRRTGAEKHLVDITDAEWRAIQAGAISPSKLAQILDKSDLKQIKQHATPKEALLMTNAKKQRAASMLAAGYTQAEVAAHLGVSLTTLKNSFR
jgi:DNA-binding NarL/FixJ family response regulator